MKKKLSKIFIIILGIGLIAITLSSSQVQAAIQSNPNTHYKKKDTVTNWMTNLRNMEVTGGALGLTETINGTTKLATSESNNLDSHMIKSTEYGAIAILSASGYGNPKTLQNSTLKTTTGNQTGVYFNFSSSHNYAELVAGVKSGVFTGIDSRYYNIYTTSNSSAKVGDALGTADTVNPGCTSWHFSGNSNNEWIGSNWLVFMRNYYGGLFNYGHASTSWDYASRGVIVCGEGL